MDIMKISAADLGIGSSVKVRTVGSPDDLAWDFALTMFRELKRNNETGKNTTFIVPVGPIGQFKRLANLCNEEGESCRDLAFINMDEYCFDDGRPVPPDHPMSFKAFMEREFHSLLDEDKRMPDENKIFPDPATPGVVDDKIAQLGGVDICFGGIGINGHVAFNEPPAENTTVEAFADTGVRNIVIARETKVVNSIFAGGDLESVPNIAVTVGMRHILGARKVRMYLDWPWQAAVVRRTVHGPITAQFPASLLQNHPDAMVTITDEVALSPDNVPK